MRTRIHLSCLVSALWLLGGCSGASTPSAPGGGDVVVVDSAGRGGGSVTDTEVASDAPSDGSSDALSDVVPAVDVVLGEVTQDAVPVQDVVSEVVSLPDVVGGSDAVEDVVTGPEVESVGDAQDASPVDGVSEDALDGDVSEATGIGELCFSEILDPAHPGPNYDQFSPTVGSHCAGTNHQDIQGVEQVVILGDSVTQGSPNDVHPTCLDNAHFYRNQLAEWLADTYQLDRGDLIGWGLFKAFNCLYDGTAGQQVSGDFHNCSKWGARTDDLLSGGGQIPQCFPGYPNFGSDKKTLAFFTMGGNDISKISQIGADASAEEVAAGYPEAWALAESTVAHLEEAIAFFKNPEMFPSGAYVVFANPFEFTDGTGDTSACSPSEISIFGFGSIDISDFGIDLAGLAGYGAWEDQSVQEAIVIWILEQYMRVAVDYQVDLVWVLESFCGHGFVATGPDADTESRCYRGPDAELYFDITCIHPNDAGHQAMSELFQAVIAE